MARKVWPPIVLAVCIRRAKCVALFGVLGLELLTGGKICGQTAREPEVVPRVRSSSRMPAVNVIEPSMTARRASMQESLQAVRGPSSSDKIAPELLPPGTPSPSTERKMTLGDLENMALANNPTLIQAASRVQAAQGRWLQGGLRPNPIIGYQASEVGNEGQAGQQGAFYSQEFVRGGKLALNRNVASGEVAQARELSGAQRLRVLNDVRTEFFNVLVAQRALALTRELSSVNKRGLETAELLFQGKQVSKPDVLQARIESASAAVALLNAENRHAAAWQRLSSVVGTPDMVPVTLAGDLAAQHPELDWNESYRRLIAQSPEMAAARAGVARAHAVLQRAQAEPIPNVDVQFGLQYDNASEYTIGNVQLGAPIPFRNRNQGNIQTAFADLRNTQADVARTELSLRTRLSRAFETYRSARNHVETFSTQILPDSRASLELVTAGYRAGEFGFISLLTAQRTFSQTNLAYLQALQELNASRIAIEGMLLTGSLQGDIGPTEVPRLMESMSPVFGPGRPQVEQN